MAGASVLMDGSVPLTAWSAGSMVHKASVTRHEMSTEMRSKHLETS